MDTIKETVSKASESDLIKFGLKTAAIAGATLVAAPAVISAAGFEAGAPVVAVLQPGVLEVLLLGSWHPCLLRLTAIVIASGATFTAFDTYKGDKSTGEIASKA
ncbi:hypothetical protein TNIN_252461 [Trichonephila inaurata madagascariensis]|uniref:Uncharacterized protein n=1 Tax=Trichonephila inaurata madagascariensis TaxID=2747483 RepID=A0A8X6XLR6_9ARAC|nr:hypothetical protein TNIN_252461 [Trichonephila inaurata madagascariensis]